MVAPNIVQDDRTTNVQGFYTLKNKEQGKEDTTDAVSHDNTRNTTDTLCMLYAKAAKRQDMNSHDYCTYICNLNTDQCHIENDQYSMVQELHKCTKTWKKPKKDTEFF